MAAFLRSLGSVLLSIFGALLTLAHELYNRYSLRSDAAEVERKRREEPLKRRQADAEREAIGAEADVQAAVKVRETISVQAPTTDDEGEALAKRLGRKLE